MVTVLGMEWLGTSTRINDDQLPTMLEEIYTGGLMGDDIDKLDERFEEKDRGNFDKLFEDAQHKAYPGCENSVLSLVIKMLLLRCTKS